jgi:tetraacyldisaccharide 4'-kinase
VFTVLALEQAAGALLDRAVTRRIAAPSRVQVVAIGGATLGGSGKTPLAIACAAELAASGARVALVGHAYRATPGRPRLVSPRDALDDVGDEALLAARALAPWGARASVVVAPSRSEAMALAARVADVLVLDGIAQLRPSPAALSILAVDPERPWGDGRSLPPRGSLRAPIATLVAASDAIVTVGDGEPAAELFDLGRSVWPSRVDSLGVETYVDEGALMTWPAVRALRVGLLTALARPERVLRALARRGVVPRAILSARDHGPFGRGAGSRAERRAREHGVDLWLATPKCALHAARALPALRVAVVHHFVTLHPSLRKRLRGLGERGQALTRP